MIPVEIVSVINLLVLFLVMQGLKAMSAQFGFDLTGKSAVVATWLSGAVIAYGNAGLATIPAEYQPIVAQALVLLSLVLGAAGIYKTVSDLK